MLSFLDTRRGEGVYPAQSFCTSKISPILTHHGHTILEKGSKLPHSLRYLYLHQRSDLELSMLPDGLTELTILNLTFQSDPRELINLLHPTLRHLKLGPNFTIENRSYLLRPGLKVTYYDTDY